MAGWEGKRIYVWFEAVIGYLSATIEWAKLTGQPSRLARLVDEPGGQGILLHRQGQYFLSRGHVAGSS